ncbi:MAG: hypothetical protein IT384_31490 [Deltaproteobacteria bacterium]|nr:hypothetical protein [Deltaproteobacteria bacterium]
MRERSLRVLAWAVVGFFGCGGAPTDALPAVGDTCMPLASPLPLVTAPGTGAAVHWRVPTTIQLELHPSMVAWLSTLDEAARILMSVGSLSLTFSSASVVDFSLQEEAAPARTIRFKPSPTPNVVSLSRLQFVQSTGEILSAMVEIEPSLAPHTGLVARELMRTLGFAHAPAGVPSLLALDANLDTLPSAPTATDQEALLARYGQARCSVE